MIENNLRLLLPKPGSITEHLSLLQHGTRIEPSSINTKKSYQRQCPDCAKELYHTDIYALPWLSKCPIHHCELTTVCPDCGQSWPNLRELDKRTCECCGRLSLKQFEKVSFKPHDTNTYLPIHEIYRFIKQEDSDYYLHNLNFSDRDGTHEHWWREFSIDSMLFPAIQTHRKPNLSVSRMKSLHINFKPVLKRSSELIASDILYHRNFDKYGKDEKIDTKDIPGSHIKSVYSVTQRILKWIFKHTQHDHEIHLVKYPQYGVVHFLQQPDPCPCCLAFSLWFYETAYQIYFPNIVYRDNHTSAYFCWESGLQKFYEIFEPAITVNQSKTYILSKSFSRWFYRRGLEISFIDILRFCFVLLDRIKRFRPDVLRGYFYASYLNRMFNDQLSSTVVIDNQLYFFYEKEHPLNSFGTPNIDDLYTQCSKFHGQLDEYNGFKLDSYEISPNTVLTLDEYVRLMNVVE
ncbi:MAG: hypothetical protein AB2563_06375 [Candidatus Thiodiazotropha endolucinida]